MKTINPSPGFRLSNVTRFCLAAGLSLATLSAAPRAKADQPNGVYQVTGGQSLVITDSGTFRVPPKYLREILTQCGPIQVRKKKLQMKGDIVECFHRILYRSLTFSDGSEVDTTKVRNSPSITFKDRGASFTGKASEPIRSTITRVYDGDIENFYLRLTTDVSAKVIDDKITVTFRYTGRSENYQNTGKIVISGTTSRTATSSTLTSLP
ncbi:MAG: hypothetical protein V4640_06800 [Verrucomicrobiota bacterium]